MKSMNCQEMAFEFMLTLFIQSMELKGIDVNSPVIDVTEYVEGMGRMKVHTKDKLSISDIEDEYINHFELNNVERVGSAYRLTVNDNIIVELKLEV